MPTTDAGPSPYSTYDRSHADGDKGSSRPSARSSTRTTSHRSRSHGPRDDRDHDYPERRARDFVVRSEDPQRSRPSNVPQDSSHGAHHTSDRDRDVDSRGAGRPAEHKLRARAISVSSGGSYEFVQVPDSTSRRDAAGAGTGSARRDRDRDRDEGGHGLSTSKDDLSVGTSAHQSSTQTPSSSRTSYAGIVRTAPPGLNADVKTTTTTSSRASGGESPTKTLPYLPRNPAEGRSGEATGAHEKERLASIYPPMAPSRGPPNIDPRAQAPVDNVQQMDTSASAAAGLPGTFVNDAPPPPPSQTRPQSQPHVQQGEMREGAQSSPEKGFLRSAVASVWPVGGAPPKDKAKEEIFRLQTECNNYREDYKRLDREYRSMRRGFQELEHERNRLRDNNHALQHELASVQHELEEAKALSDIRGKELVGAQVFLTKADALSISDVVEKVNVLNEEIFQASAFFAEGIVMLHESKMQEFSQEDMARFYEHVVNIIGPLLTNVLHAQAQAPDPQVHPLIAQVVLSCFLVQFCIQKLSSWYPSDANIDQFLGTVYSQIRHNEEQAVFGRWRSLLRAQIRPSTDTWKKELTDSLQSILNFASWDAPSDTKMAFAHKLGPIIKALEDMRCAIYEKYTSADLEAFFVIPGGAFEAWMEDAYGDERGGESGRAGPGKQIVAGTTGVGLKKLRVSSRGSGSGHRSAGVEKYENVLSPKVILESTLREALEPPPPSKGRKRRAPAGAEEGGR